MSCRMDYGKDTHSIGINIVTDAIRKALWIDPTDSFSSETNPKPEWIASQGLNRLVYFSHEGLSQAWLLALVPLCRFVGILERSRQQKNLEAHFRRLA